MSVIYWCVLLLAATLARAQLQCGQSCFQGSVLLTSQAVISFQFATVPCAPSRVLYSSVAINGVQVDTSNAQFTCAKDGIVASLTFAISPSRRLVWNYQSDVTCETILAALDTIQGDFLGSDHMFDGSNMLTDADLSSYQVLCSQQQMLSPCETLNYDSGVFTVYGLAGSKSPCGLTGTRDCQARIVFQTTGRGDCPTGAAPAVSNFDIYMGPAGTALVAFSTFDPDVTEGATLTCSQSRIVLRGGSSANTLFEMVWPAPTLNNSATCDTLMRYLSLLGASKATSLEIELLSLDQSAAEAWLSNSTTRLPSFVDAATAVPSTGTDGSEDPNSETDPNAETVFITKPVHPFLHCNYKFLKNQTVGLPGDWCCAIYGYKNPNSIQVVIPAMHDENWINPKFITTFPLATFNANANVTQAFDVVWRCDVYTHHFATWNLKTRADDGSGRVWGREQAVANRERNDCVLPLPPGWCIPPIPASNGN